MLSRNFLIFSFIFQFVVFNESFGFVIAEEVEYNNVELEPFDYVASKEAEYEDLSAESLDPEVAEADNDNPTSVDRLKRSFGFDQFDLKNECNREVIERLMSYFRWPTSFYEAIYTPPIAPISEGVGVVFLQGNNIYTDGITKIEGAVPIAGAVSYEGPVKACGTTTVAGRCVPASGSATPPLLGQPLQLGKQLGNQLTLLSSPVTSPLDTMLSPPVTPPLETLLAYPVTSPLETLLSSPVTSPLETLLSYPVTSPLETLLSSPVTSPLETLLSYPVTSPLETLLSSPMISPLETLPAPVQEILPIVPDPASIVILPPIVIPAIVTPACVLPELVVPASQFYELANSFGNVMVTGTDLLINGVTYMDGAVATIGDVTFGGYVPAKGAVTICGCF